MGREWEKYNSYIHVVTRYCDNCSKEKSEAAKVGRWKICMPFVKASVAFLPVLAPTICL